MSSGTALDITLPAGGRTNVPVQGSGANHSEHEVLNPGAPGRVRWIDETTSAGRQLNLRLVSIRPVVAVEKRRRYAVGEIPKARAK